MQAYAEEIQLCASLIQALSRQLPPNQRPPVDAILHPKDLPLQDNGDEHHADNKGKEETIYELVSNQTKN